MDLVEDKGSRSSDRSTGSNPESDLDQPRSCVDCKTTKTPLWRAGPNGPKSLCNACGIRYKKKKKAATDLASKELVKMKNNTKMGVPTLGSKELGKMKNTTKMGVSLQLVHMRSGIMKLKQGVLREEEEAAVLLMALSSGILCSAKN